MKKPSNAFLLLIAFIFLGFPLGCGDGNNEVAENNNEDKDSFNPSGINAFTSANMTYFKASNTGIGDAFGVSLALSADGNTMVVGTQEEDSNATGINGNQLNNSMSQAGAVYVFIKNGPMWFQEAYIKASNTGASDYFGSSVSLSADGNTLAVGAPHEDSNATGVNGNQLDNSMLSSGAAYVYKRKDGIWLQQAYVKASNTGAGDLFGGSISLAPDGKTLAVGAPYEDSNSTGINGNQLDNSAYDSGAVYTFVSTGTTWQYQVYIKASNTNLGDVFGLDISQTSKTLAVGAPGEDSNATGINGNQFDNSAVNSGAVYTFLPTGMSWIAETYIKASNTDAGDAFGAQTSLSSDGQTLAVGALHEDSKATGINGNQFDNSMTSSGAAYIFKRIVGWNQQAYVKASNTGSSDWFGVNLSLSGDGKTLAVGAWEASNATGVNGNQLNNSSFASGAVYVIVDNGLAWQQQDYVKASNTDPYDQFGRSTALSTNGKILAVGANREASNATGINGNQFNNTGYDSGAVYLYY